MPLPIEAFDNLLHTRSIAELQKEVGVITAHLDLDYFLFGTRIEIPGQPVQDFIINGYPDAWWNNYQKNQYHQVDPIVAHCQQSHRPLIWSHDAPGDTSNAKSMFEEAASFDIQHGASFSVHNSMRREFSLLSLASGARQVSKAHNSLLLGQGQLLATFLVEAVQGLMPKTGKNTPLPLTRRERECLKWAAAGKSSWEISCILSTSERTVNFHIGNLLAKLDVVNRQQAIAKAMSLGLL